MAYAQAREAIAHAINGPALMQVLLSGYALPVTQFLTAKHLGYDPKLALAEAARAADTTYDLFVEV